MKSTAIRPYSITLDDKRNVRIESAQSAGDAITQALWENRGRKVIRCFQGGEHQEKGYPVGIQEFAVPPHEAVAEDAKKPRVRKKDATMDFAFVADLPREINAG